MIQSRRELRLLRESSSPKTEEEITLHPEVLRAVAKKMRTRLPYPENRMPINRYILSDVYHKFVDALEAVADDTEHKVVKFLPQQEDTDGTEGSNRI